VPTNDFGLTFLGGSLCLPYEFFSTKEKKKRKEKRSSALILYIHAALIIYFCDVYN